MKAELQFIGHIETPYNTLDECPRNIDKHGPLCKLVIKDQFKEGLSGLVAGKKIAVLYWFEKVNRNACQQQSRTSDKVAGVFALRTPNRPNPIAAATLVIEKIGANHILAKGLDCLNGTPLLDIKPAMSDE